jgi:hypothetical protein
VTPARRAARRWAGRADGPGAPLQQLEPLADVADQHLGEERELGLVEVESCLSLIDRCKELGDLGGERAVRIEHGAHGVGECGRFGAVDIECQQCLTRQSQTGRRTPTGVPQDGEMANRQRGPISSLKRGYGWDRTRIDGLEGARIWTGQAVLAHNLVKIGALAG